jgi:pimeloyl-ACP methyl ester carboxylesterase
MDEDFVPSNAKTPGRRIWVLDRRSVVPTFMLVFLDAELYLERVGAAQVVQQLKDEGHIPPAVSVFVSNNGASSRHTDYVCDEDYSRFLSDELLPSMLGRNPGLRSDRVVVIGLSLSGLAAAHAAITTCQFRAAVCQSPSFWWERERFALSLSRAPSMSAAFWVSVGILKQNRVCLTLPPGSFRGRPSAIRVTEHPRLFALPAMLYRTECFVADTIRHVGATISLCHCHRQHRLNIRMEPTRLPTRATMALRRAAHLAR